LGQYQQAFQSYNEAIRVDHQFAPAYADRAAVHAWLGDEASARRDFAETAHLGFDPLLLDQTMKEAKMEP
jgi:Flp pilus assembly protein TadD